MQRPDKTRSPDKAAPDIQAADQYPGDLEASHRLALSLLEFRRLAEAENLARAALVNAPESAQWLDVLGMALMARGRFAEALIQFERARELAPDYPQAYGNLAILHERANRIDAALEVIGDGLKRWPAFITLQFVHARCQRRSGQYTQAQLALQKLLRGPLTIKLHLDIEFELAWCADAAGESREASRHFSRANALAEKLPTHQAAVNANYLQMVVSFGRRFDGDWARSWRELPRTGCQEDPVFIIGFPRSGTTLLDTMLGAHPALAVLEEQPALQTMLESLANCPGGYPDGLASLTAAQQTAAREVYRQAATAAIGPTGTRRLLDKSPLHTVHVGAMQRVFPGAPILFMTRHPFDVVLSCFMTNFEPNAGTVCFTALESTVRLYCEMMSLWLSCSRQLPLNFRQVRYEDLLAEPERELRAILEFINLPWSDAVLDHVTHASERGPVSNASYAQVGRPLYHEAHGRWRRYAHCLEPYHAQLQPYIEVFGYAG
ncbi:MAG: sulfotransferase [Gammaproteobacteria bacterium]